MAEPSLISNLKRIDAGFSTYFLIENQHLRQLCDYKSHLLACSFFFVPYWGFSICPNGKKKKNVLTHADCTIVLDSSPPLNNSIILYFEYKLWLFWMCFKV